MTFWSILLMLVAGVGSASARSAQVILFRHAEKPRDELDERLSERGRMRARALASCLTTNLSFLSNGMPVALFAPKFTRHGNVHRPYETLEPLAKELNLTIQMPYDRESHSELVKWILNNPSYDGKTVIICWVHDYLSAMAKDLGVRSKPLTRKGSLYDRFWVITFDQSVANLPQRLLPGDSVE
jgi:hypothetical protein